MPVSEESPHGQPNKPKIQIMKKQLLTLCCAIGIASSSVMAQNVKTSYEQKRLAYEQKKIDIFQGAESDVIPILQTSSIERYNDIRQKNSHGAHMRSLAEYPALYQSVISRKTKDDAGRLTAIGEFGSISWTMLTNPENGNSMLITIEYDPSDVDRNGVRNYSRGVTITCYDDSLKATKDFYLKTSDTTQSVIIMSQYSTNYFNWDDKMEFMIHAHSFAAGYGPESCRDTMFIVNEDGEILQRIGNTSDASLHTAPGEFFDENRIAVSPAYYSGLHDTTFTYIYEAGNFVGETPVPLFRFAIPDNLVAYSSGPMASIMEIEGEPFYVTTQYAKPFISNGDMLNPIVEKDNEFRIIMLDMNFDTVKDIRLPLFGIEENDYSMASLDYFDKYRITRHTFNNDDKIEIVYGINQYHADCDCEMMNLYLVDEDGNIIQDIAEQISGVKRLLDIPGQEDEYAISMSQGDGISGFQMFRMPDMEKGFFFPANLNGDQLSSTFDRAVNVNGGYDYIFALGMGEADDETTYGIIARYDQEGQPTQRIQINIGKNGAVFSPLFNASTLNPYTFVPDEEMEYLYMSATLDDAGMHRRLGIATAEKNLYVIDDNPEHGSIANVGLLRDMAGTKNHAMFVSFSPDGISVSKTIFYQLPLETPDTLQGQGTEEDPYVITNAFELDQIRNYPDAYFILGNDIDMASYSGLDGSGFISIPEFYGHLDGQNHCLSNLHLTSHGLFALLMPEASIENLRMENISFEEGYAIMGSIAGQSMGGIIRNCHVSTEHSSFGNEMFGGIVGEASAYTIIDQCSFQGSINVAKGENVGGIAGQLKTGSTIMNSTTKGSIKGVASVGGICGSTSRNGGNITDCYSSMDVTGSESFGGIIGENTGQITRTYADGNILFAQNDQTNFPGGAGGIAGSTSLTGSGQIKYSFALNDTVWAPENFARIAYATMYDNYQGSPTLDSNFAKKDIRIGASMEELDPVNDTNCAINRMHGESHELADFTQEFYSDYGWAFGSDSAAPWQMSGSKPRLWWEFNVRGVELPFAETTIDKGESLTLVPVIIPADASNKNVFFATSDAAVASVNQEGVVTANNAGSATITVTTEEGGMTASCIINVEIPVEEVRFTADTFYVAKMADITVTAEAFPEDATNKGLRYYSLDPSIARSVGSLITGMEPGYAKVVAAAEKGDASDTCVVRVYIPVEQIFLNESSITLNNATPSFQLRATLYPDDATEVPLTWTSTDENVATVSNTGMVSGHAMGSATVTVSTSDGAVSASCYVQVTENVANEGADAVSLTGRIDHGDFVLECSLPIAAVQIYSTAGNLAYANHSFNACMVRIPGGGFSNGLYLIRATLEDGQQAIVKLIK